MRELSELEYFFSNLNYEHLFAVKGKKLTEEQAKEIIHRCKCHKALVDACEQIKGLTFNTENDPRFLLDMIGEIVETVLAEAKKE